MRHKWTSVIAICLEEPKIQLKNNKIWYNGIDVLSVISTPYKKDKIHITQ